MKQHILYHKLPQVGIYLLTVLDVSLGQEGFEKLWSLPLYEPTDNKTAYAGYWTSVVRANGTMLGALKDNGTIKAFQEKNTKDGRGYFRFALAF